MIERTRRPVVALLVVAVLTTLTATTQFAAPSETAEASTAVNTTAAPSRARYERWATISKLKNGYYYDAGQQDTHLVVTRVNRGVRFVDTRTDVLRSKPNACHRKHARVGIVVVCRVPTTVNARHPMTVKVFTRLGNDYINTSKLSAAFELYMLADKGRDVVRAGAGHDFVNGAQQRDRVWGGPGNDWIRTGLGDDDITGGAGRDQLVGVYGQDTVLGGDGNDRVGGGPGNDRLYAGGGTNYVLCGPGTDRAHADRVDRVARDCESVDFG